MKIFKNKRIFYKINKKFFGIGSFHSKYVIVGCGYSGYSLDPFKIRGDEITIIDPIPDNTIYPLLKYHCYGQKNISDTTHKLDDILPNKIKLRHHDILQIDPETNLLLGSESLRQTYEKLILACGLEADYSEVPGLLYSLQDSNDPIFTSYEYDTVMTKFCIYSVALIDQIKYDFGKNLSMKNTEFLNNGKGNIIFSNVSPDIFDILENIQMIILLYDLILTKRQRHFIDKLNFCLCLPISKEEFLMHSKELNGYFINLLQERKININWNYKLKEVKSNNILKFQIAEDGEGIEKNIKTNIEIDETALKILNKSKNQNLKYLEMEYNFAYIIPKFNLPSFIRYNPLFEEKKRIEFDPKRLNLKEFENIFLMGDALAENSFLYRFYPNILRQAETISNNLKASHFRLGNSHMKEYQPSNHIFFDFMMKDYLIFNQSTDNHKILKKNIWNNFLFKHLYLRPEGFYAQKMLLKRKF